MTLYVNYKSVFDSMSHIYLFKSLEGTGVNLKTRQLHKTIYITVKFTVKVNGEVMESFSIVRGQIEEDTTSPIYFNIGIETVFREADVLNNAVMTQDGINVEGLNVDKVGFADDVQLLPTEGVDRLSTRIQNIQKASKSAGLGVSKDKTFDHHIDRNVEVAAGCNVR